ncbi:MAG: hypothetical protein C0404_10120 [Verrucomicrobia bacterium]|nr:hypothetical protein [Verrucomicrobiota bacterium]
MRRREYVVVHYAVLLAVLLIFVAGTRGLAAQDEKKIDANDQSKAAVMLFPIVKDGKWGYMDQAGKVVISPQYDCAWDFSEGLACVQVGLLRGYIDAKNTMVIKPWLPWGGKFCDGRAAAQTKAPPWGDNLMFYVQHQAWKYINREGKIVFGDFYTRPPDFREGISIVRGFVDVNGRAIPCDVKPEAVGPFSEGMAAVKKDGLWGYVDHSMKLVVEPKFADAGMFGDGLAAVGAMLDADDPAKTTTWTKAGKYSLGVRGAPEKTWGTNSIALDDGDSLALGGTKVFTFEVTAPAKEGRHNFQWQMQQAKGFGDTTPAVPVTVVGATNLPLFTTQPKVVTVAAGATATFTAAATGGTVAYQWKKNGADITGATGESYTTPAVTKADNDCRFSVVASNAAGRVRSVDALLTIKPDGLAAEKPATDASAAAGQENRARFIAQGVPDVMVAGQTYQVSIMMKNAGPKVMKWGFIDKAGQPVIEPVFADAWPFSGGLASVLINGKWGYIDKTGKEAIKAEYDYAWPFSEGLGRVLKGGKHGYVDAKGQMVIEPKYDVAWEFSRGLARVEIDGKEGYIDGKGKYVWEPTK